MAEEREAGKRGEPEDVEAQLLETFTFNVIDTISRRGRYEDAAKKTTETEGSQLTGDLDTIVSCDGMKLDSFGPNERGPR